jgi:DNA adenine methylase
MSDIDKTPFAYMGNKSTIVDWVISYFPPAYTKMRYVEVFGGTGRVLMEKLPSEVEIYNDFNSHLTNFFEVLRSHKEEFFEQLDQLVISEDLYNYFYKEIDNSPNDIERAVRYFYIMSFCHKGKFNGGFSVIADPNYTHKLQTKKATLEYISRRLKNVLITNKSYEKIVSANNTEDTFLYLDPPYVNTESYYQKLAGQFTQQDHIKLRDLLKAHKGTFLLSYEADPFVADLYSDFLILGKNKYRPGKGSSAEEVLVTNRKETLTLFSEIEKRNTVNQTGLFS